MRPLETDPTSFPAACSRYIAMALDLASPPRHLTELTANADAILTALLAELDHVKDHPPSRQRVAAIMRWAHEKLRPATAQKRSVAGLLPLWPAEADSAAA